MSPSTPATRRVVTTALAVALALGTAACGSSPSGSGSTAPSGASSSAAAPLVLEDGWVKAVEAMGSMSSASPSSSMSTPSSTASGGTDMGGMDMGGMDAMSAMFGTLRNTSGSPVTVTGGSTPVAGKVELHETVKNASGQMQMQPKEGGFVIPAGGSFVLQPGANHVMLMELTGGLANGSTVAVTLTTSAGTVTFTVPVRAFSGAQESYVPTPSPS